MMAVRVAPEPTSPAPVERRTPLVPHRSILLAVSVLLLSATAVRVAGVLTGSRVATSRGVGLLAEWQTTTVLLTGCPLGHRGDAVPGDQLGDPAADAPSPCSAPVRGRGRAGDDVYRRDLRPWSSHEVRGGVERRLRGEEQMHATQRPEQSRGVEVVLDFREPDDVRLDVVSAPPGAGAREAARLVCGAVHEARLRDARRIHTVLDASGPTCGVVLEALHEQLGRELERIDLRRAGSSVLAVLEVRPHDATTSRRHRAGGAADGWSTREFSAPWRTPSPTSDGRERRPSTARAAG